MEPYAYDLHPVAKRSLQNFRVHLLRGTAAVYLGAGVDRQLAADAGQESPDWVRLIAETNPFPDASAAELATYAKEWPTETAFSARLRLGEQAFKEVINKKTNYNFKPNLKKAFTRELSSLLLKTNLIVTPNYASHVLASLKLRIENEGLSRKKEVIVLTREDLASFQFPVAQPDPGRIFLIHIHGRCVESSNIIFDAWGYNVAINDDPYYHKFLYDLFSYRSVISIGTSWSDIPLRNQAALVFRTQSYQRPSHISFEYCASKAELAKQLQPNSAKRKWANAMNAAYGVRMIVTDSKRQVSLLQTLNQSKLDEKASPKFKDLAEIAAFFDSCGDYESSLQQQWLLKVSPSRSISPAIHIQDAVIKLYKKLINGLRRNLGLWEVAARLERHLRHFHYLYVIPYVPNNKCHIQLWDLLAQKVTNSIWKRINNEVRFQFLIGQYELNRSIPNTIRGFSVDHRLYKKRLSKADMIWNTDLDIDALEDAALELLDLGWESMASKLFLDAATKTAKRANPGYDPKNNERILGLAFRGGDIARSVGCFRRETKAETLIAMWLPDPQESRIRILSKIRAAEFHPDAGGTTPLENIDIIEPALLATLTAGLFASHIRNVHLHSGNPAAVDDKLKVSISPLLEEAGIKWQDVPMRLLPYWEDLIEKRLQPQFLKAINGEYRSAT
ncbi:MAG: SIR2 family protein [Acidobacteriota bacterium]|nr:SIR2 family protein [Acidobacteriota bacterium]